MVYVFTAQRNDSVGLNELFHTKHTRFVKGDVFHIIERNIYQTLGSVWREYCFHTFLRRCDAKNRGTNKRVGK